ncbi:MAG TPA: sulfate ABC transporter substrate-binding protein [Stellaceae bacterium]|nr:sulfate ABC transporter substrate-binding protein [Stellaceae bacterium]
MPRTLLLIACTAAVLGTGHAKAAEIQLLNVSYDPTREFYTDVNKVFTAEWKAKTGETLAIRTSNGGSGAQARSVIDGLEADVVTLAVSADIDAIAKTAQLLPTNWQSKLPDDSAPYTSTIVLLVRKGNPKHIKDWGDLVKPGVSVITPNPKTSGGARWNFLAAWAWARKANNGDDKKAQDFVAQLYQHVPVLDSGARGSTVTFVQRRQGDVLIAWENEAQLAIQQLGKDNLQIVYPSVSILAEPPVAVVEENAKKHHTLKQAQAYLQFLYSEEGQELAAKHYYRPRSSQALQKYASQFPKIDLVTIKDFGGWAKAQPEFFGDGGVFDQIYQPK